MSKEESKPDNTESWKPFTLNIVPDPNMIDVRIRLLDGSELNVWQQLDGDFWSEYLKIFITPEKVTHWKQIDQNIEKELSKVRKENDKISSELIAGMKVQVNQKVKIEDLESQLSKAKERIEFLEMQLRHLKENKNTDAPF